ncbi:hypothetical protein HY493_02010 [Candidatus Woesearchaeota archaeon]|nr:hypothetical protein [Candidatus Woesearchaeota archaeon]
MSYRRGGVVLGFPKYYGTGRVILVDIPHASEAPPMPKEPGEGPPAKITLDELLEGLRAFGKDRESRRPHREPDEDAPVIWGS